VAAARQAGKGWQTPLGAMRRDRPFVGAYRIAFGLAQVPTLDEDLPLLLSVRRFLWGQLKGVRARTAIYTLVTGP